MDVAEDLLGRLIGGQGVGDERQRDADDDAAREAQQRDDEEGKHGDHLGVA